ncbi:MAG: AbrB/MazE/SpoVT family DNA-binding domain-containing protein [Pseudobdellovibrionaceae bacterium]|nr:AbrB/MazE/SpoVT family DNA-binding domain-containing protein [Bdellovibrionales bacterium]USN47792.1 MAG: AbrB/MazE/SpoVT family DNA-binding domain-containing protein [Pseudobdellovibrionaceae bacterium]
MAVKVSSKYQVVIPEKVRTLLGLQPGTQVDVIAKGGIAYIVPVPDIEDLKENLEGKLSTKNVRDKKDRKF